MPLYEYECEACGHRFERIQKFSDPLVKVCPHCGKRKVHKLLSSPAIKFKGSGFYINDYAAKSTATEAGKAEGAKSDAAKADTSAPSTAGSTATESSPAPKASSSSDSSSK